MRSIRCCSLNQTTIRGNDLSDTVIIGCKAGIAKITITHNDVSEVLDYDISLSANLSVPTTLKLDNCDSTSPLFIEALGKNGRLRKITDVWRLLSTRNFVRIHNSDIILQKRSARRYGPANKNEDEDNNDTDIEMDKDDDDADDEDEKKHHWTVMLNEKGKDGRLSRVTAVDLRVGCILDGAVSYFADGHTPCGPRFDTNGNEHTFGGHQSEKLRIPQDTEIVKVEVNVGSQGWDKSILGGILMTLSNGAMGGALNTRGREEEDGVAVLEAGEDETIVGFFSTSQSWGYMTEFGILTVPKGVELPAQTYDIPELQNIQEA